MRIHEQRQPLVAPRLIGGDERCGVGDGGLRPGEDGDAWLGRRQLGAAHVHIEKGVDSTANRGGTTLAPQPIRRQASRRLNVPRVQLAERSRPRPIGWPAIFGVLRASRTNLMPFDVCLKGLAVDKEHRKTKVRMPATLKPPAPAGDSSGNALPEGGSGRESTMMGRPMNSAGRGSSRESFFDPSNSDGRQSRRPQVPALWSAMRTTRTNSDRHPCVQAAAWRA